MIILNTTEKHVKERILGYITLPGSEGKICLYKVVERHYRHPQALEYAVVVRTETIYIYDIPDEYEHAVHLLNHQQTLLMAVMNPVCQE